MLIHGAWHASWCWQRVAAELFLQGHQVLAPDLPGHGLSRQLSSAVGFNDYVASVVKLIQSQSRPVTLVGHSMGGLVISAAVDRVPDLIDELVFVTAYIPQSQKSLFSLAQELDSDNLTSFLIIDELLQEIRLHSSPDLANILFNRCSTKDVKKAIAHLQPQPLRPFTDPVTVGESFHVIPKRSLVCRYDQALILSDQLRMSRTVTENIVYLDADHAVYFSATKQLVSELLKPKKNRLYV